MHPPKLIFLTAPDWRDYELLDSGNGRKLERYGAYIFNRPEHQAIWRTTYPAKSWESAHAVFHSTQEESGGRWQFNEQIPHAIRMEYKGLTFSATPGNSRHLGVFPEQAAHWDWINRIIVGAKRPVRVLNLFGYTGLASLASAQAGAQVTHVDASKKVVAWARENQALSGLMDRPIRWLIDDAEKFVKREVRRNSAYDGIILDPPKFGRGPAGEVWEFFESLPGLLDDCRKILSPQPLFIVLTAYAIRASALSVYYALDEITKKWGGSVQTGELALIEKSAGRLLPTAIFARWEANQSE